MKRIRSAERLFQLETYIVDRAGLHGMISRGGRGIRPRGAYGLLLDRVAVLIDRTPIMERQPIYNRRMAR